MQLEVLFAGCEISILVSACIFVLIFRGGLMFAKLGLFARLYVYAFSVWFSNRPIKEPQGLGGQKVFLFTDPERPGKKHGVVAFVLPFGFKTEELSSDLFGPFGYTSQIDLDGLHLYGRDTWGVANDVQILANPELRELAFEYFGQPILLAGVRKLWGIHIPPLNNAGKFILVKK